MPPFREKWPWHESEVSRRQLQGGVADPAVPGTSLPFAAGLATPPCNFET